MNSFSLLKLPYGPIGIEEGVIFCTYSALIASKKAESGKLRRLDQLIAWCGKKFDGCILLG